MRTANPFVGLPGSRLLAPIDGAYYTAQVPNPMAGLIPNNGVLNGAVNTHLDGGIHLCQG